MPPLLLIILGGWVLFALIAGPLVGYFIRRKDEQHLEAVRRQALTKVAVPKVKQGRVR